MKHLKTLENIRPATSCSCSYVKSMVNGGDLCLLNNGFPGFHISGVCSDISSFNRIQRRIRMLLTTGLSRISIHSSHATPCISHAEKR